MTETAEETFRKRVSKMYNHKYGTEIDMIAKSIETFLQGKVLHEREFLAQRLIFIFLEDGEIGLNQLEKFCKDIRNDPIMFARVKDYY